LYHGTAAAAAAAAIAAASRIIMVTDIVELFSVAVKPSLLSHAIKSSLPCSSFESVPLIVTTQRTLGFGQGHI